MTEPLTTISWDSPTAITNSEQQQQITSALSADLASPIAFDAWPNTDPYTFGKEASKYARLALIADAIGDTETAVSVCEMLQPYLEMWFNGSNGDVLLHDTVRMLL